MSLSKYRCCMHAFSVHSFQFLMSRAVELGKPQYETFLDFCRCSVFELVHARLHALPKCFLNAPSVLCKNLSTIDIVHEQEHLALKCEYELQLRPYQNKSTITTRSLVSRNETIPCELRKVWYVCAVNMRAVFCIFKILDAISIAWNVSTKRMQTCIPCVAQ